MGDLRRPRPGKLLEVARVWGRLLRLRMGGRIDCLLFPAGGPQVVPLLRDMLLLPACLLAARRVVIVFHAGGIAGALPTLPRWLAWAVRAFYRRTTAAIVLTQAGRADPQAVGIADIKVVPNGLPDAYDLAACAGRSPNGGRLLYVGHLCPDKGIPEILGAMALLRTEFPGLHLTLVGEPSNPWTTADLDAAVAAHGLEGAVERPGLLVGADKWRAYGTADAFVFPSHAPYEGFPLALIEAMMWHLPVAATRWRGIPEVLGERPGAWAGAPYGAGELAEALAALLRERGAWPDLGARNRRRYEERFHLDAVAARLRDALLETLERKS
jgi:glycosyltransferase involved in cell wall biosynthesis